MRKHFFEFRGVYQIKPGKFCRNSTIEVSSGPILPVHLREQEIPYETTTTQTRLLHGNYRPDHADPGRLCPCREGPREPSARTKWAGDTRSAHSVRSPCRDPHPAFRRFRVREIPAPPRRYIRHNVTGCRITLFLKGYRFCHGMADADDVPGNERRPFYVLYTITGQVSYHLLLIVR